MYDDGSGPALFVTGVRTIDGVHVNGIVKLSGTVWSRLGSGVWQGTQGGGATVAAVYDDGRGPALYVGGTFSYAGGHYAPGLARWDGSNWSPPSTDFRSHWINALCVYDDGNGPALYVGGAAIRFDDSGYHTIAKWDGNRWSALGQGAGGPVIDRAQVVAMTVFDDGSGPALYIGGNFTEAGGQRADYIAKWDGREWTSLHSGFNRIVNRLTVFDDGAGPTLYVGGRFQTSVTGDSFVARYRGCASSCYPDCDQSTGPRVLDIFDYLCFGNEFAAGSAYACDCDTSTGLGVCDIFDYLCFGSTFSVGCP